MTSSSQSDGVRRGVLALDALVLVLAMALTFPTQHFLRHHLPWLKAPSDPSEYTLALALGLPLWLGLIAWTGQHRFLERPFHRFELLLSLGKIQVLGFLAFTVVLFATQSVFNRSLVGLFLAWSSLLLWLEREVLVAWFRHLYDSGLGRPRFLLVGPEGPVEEAFRAEAATQAFPPEWVGRLVEGADSLGGEAASSPSGAEDLGEQEPGEEEPGVQGPGRSAAEGLPVLGSPGDLPEVLRDHAVDWVMFLPPYRDEDQPETRELLSACAEVGVPAGFPRPPVCAALPPPRAVQVCEVPVVAFAPASQPPLQIACKHALDAVAAGALLLVLSPILGAAALAILLTMGRPIFFVQRRTGLFGREFGVVKFRTMKLGAEAERDSLLEQNEMDGPVFKIARDPRITTLGAFLRRSSIDELPQLWNVLVGEMSLVGPRPLPVQEQRDIVGWQRRRLTMRPGITGLWQVSGRNEIDFEGWMRLDQRYVEQWSPGLDLWILLRTIPAVLGGRGAS